VGAIAGRPGRWLIRAEEWDARPLRTYARLQAMPDSVLCLRRAALERRRDPPRGR
jgi:hypothetical protein